METKMIQIAGYNFDGPYKFQDHDLIDFACVYVILCPTTANKYSVIDVGQTGQAASRLSGHERKDCWTNNCRTSLYVALHRMPTNKYSEEDRRTVETEIRNKFSQIPCGVE